MAKIARDKGEKSKTLLVGYILAMGLGHGYLSLSYSSLFKGQKKNMNKKSQMT